MSNYITGNLTSDESAILHYIYSNTKMWDESDPGHFEKLLESSHFLVTLGYLKITEKISDNNISFNITFRGLFRYFLDSKNPETHIHSFINAKVKNVI